MPVPVILDTDIGLDVDDVWALAFMLKCPEIDVKLITTNTGDTTYPIARIYPSVLAFRSTLLPARTRPGWVTTNWVTIPVRL